MLLVKTRLGPSSRHGLGVFAAEFIPSGIKVWAYCEGFDHRLSKEFAYHRRVVAIKDIKAIPS